MQNQVRRMTTYSSKDHIYELPDGRKLGYADYGSPTGKPLLYFHGYPSCRLEASVADEMAKRHNIRLIAVDRPGFGLSTPQPNRRLMDWPADVRNIAEGLNIPQFAVMGCSGGGPFALACASSLPKSMLTGVGLFASGPPWAAGAHHMSLYRRVFVSLAKVVPGAVSSGLGLLIRLLVWVVNTRPVVSRTNRWLVETSKKSQNESSGSTDGSSDASPETRTPEERRQNLLRMLVYEPFVQGPEAAVHEALILSSKDWGFDFENVQYDAVKVWHGAKDKNAPAVAIRYLTERLPHCRYTEFEEDTHYTMWKHFEGALTDLMSEDSEQKAHNLEIRVHNRSK
ncbi:unnamed protein product [Clonostachys rosea f. rosea IK726]|uniref:Uncharacterized protein n=1 Tax=Clonostachys rosea f. rosea IK726 TaxID=1349383 RepID=A0ACA9UJP8_BIOOC|nr:unnamed protein product [Clonostachys rosea f. rosea IK726]